MLFNNELFPNLVQDREQINIFIRWCQNNGDWGVMTGIAFSTCQSCFCIILDFFLNEFISIAKLMLWIITTSIQWFLRDYKEPLLVGVKSYTKVKRLHDRKHSLKVVKKTYSACKCWTDKNLYKFLNVSWGFLYRLPQLTTIGRLWRSAVQYLCYKVIAAHA